MVGSGHLWVLKVKVLFLYAYFMFCMAPCHLIVTISLLQSFNTASGFNEEREVARELRTVGRGNYNVIFLNKMG